MSKHESKFASTLRELGFVLHKLKDPLPPEIVKKLERPVYMHIGILLPGSNDSVSTWVTDETGQTWTTEGEVDLSAFGFQNAFELLVANVGGLKPKH